MPQIETLYGRVDVPDNTGDLIRRFLEYYGEWAGLEAKFAAQLTEPGGRILDLGAFLGTFSLGIAKYGQPSFICAVEGNDTVSGLTSANLKRNLTVESRLIPAVVVGSPGIRTKQQDGTNLGATSFVARGGGHLNAPHQPFVVLSDVIGENGPFDLIKMDVEGMELELLRSMDLELNNATLWIECNDRPASIEVCKLLLERGYEVGYFAFPSHNPDNFMNQDIAIFPYAYEAGLVARRGNLGALKTFDEDGCFYRSISTTKELVDALRHTPRWCPPGWETLSKAELVAVGTRHLLEGPEDSAAMEDGIRPLGIAETMSRLTAELRLTQAELRRERQRHFALGKPLSTPEPVTVSAPAASADPDELVELQRQIVKLDAELAAVSNSLTVRVARKVARAMAKVPGATRAARLMTKLVDRALR